MGGSKSKLSGPSHAFLGSDGRPYFEPDPDEERARCCCVYVARGVLKMVIAVFLIGVVGLNVTALVAGPKQYFTYYTNKNINPPYQFKTGWLKWSDSTHPGTTMDLKELSKGLYIMGIISAAVMIVSSLLALLFAVQTIFSNAGRRTCCCAFPIGVIQIGCLVAYYVLAAVWVADRNGNIIKSKNAPWPSWAWFFVAGAGVAWVLASILYLAIPRPTKHIPNEYLQTEAAAARGWGGRASQAPQFVPPESEAARMDVNAPSSAPVQAEPRLSYSAGAPGNGSRKGFFGGKSGGDGSSKGYRSRTEEIADRYRNRGASADIELPYQHPARKAWD